MVIATSHLAGLGVLRGLWQFLTARVEAKKEIEKARIELERDRERNRAVAGYIAALPEWSELEDFEDEGGRKVRIKKNGIPFGHSSEAVPPAVVILPDSPGELTAGSSRAAGEIDQ
jgi:hypothetical protein